MTRNLRRIIFFGFSLVFLIITPAILFYAFGYNFDWQKKSIVKTGAFYFKSYPKGAQIFINEKSKNKTPQLIKRLLPKDYQVKISKDGYHPWQKQLKIESYLVTEARNIFLLPEKPNLELVDDLSLNFSGGLENYFLKDEQKQKISQASTTANTIIKTNSYTLLDNNIFYFQPPNYLLYRTDINGSANQQLTLTPLAVDSYKIIVSTNQKYIAALDKNGQLYLLNPEKRIFDKLADETTGAEFSLDNKKLLYWTNSEIWVIFLEDILIQPYKKAGEKELITRFAEKITDATWYSEDNEHIIFTVGETIKITELDGRDRRNTYDIFSAKNPEIYYNQKDDLLYFITNNKLYSLDLLE